MVKSCCVPFCRSRKTRDCKLLFHSFPVSANLRRQWLTAVQQDTRKSPRNPSPFKISEHTKVCSKHFLETDYWYVGSIVRLRKNAVPTVFTWPKKKEGSAVTPVTFKERQTEENPDSVAKKKNLGFICYIHSKDAKCSKGKLKSKKFRPLDTPINKQDSIKELKKLKDQEMIQNCRNLLTINTDHSYAACWQNESVEGKKDSSSEDNTDDDEPGIPCKANISENTTNSTDMKEESSVTAEAVTVKTQSICPEESNIETADTNSTESHNNMGLVDIDTSNTIESIYLKEEVIEAFGENIEEDNICTSSNNMLSTSNKNDDTPCNEPLEKQSVCTNNTGTQNTIESNNVLHKKPSKRSNVLSKGNLPEICILCATANMTGKNYTLIVHFAEMIMDMSGVDILKSNVPPTACNVCFKNVLEMWNFKQQIIAADKFIREKIPKQPQTYTNVIPKSGSGSIPKPNAFEYIDCNQQNSNNAAISIEGDEQLENIGNIGQQMFTKRRNKPHGVAKAKTNKIQNTVSQSADLPKKDSEITLVPIENILKESRDVDVDNEYNDNDSESSEDDSDLPTCTVCEKAYTNNSVKICRCEETVKKKKVQIEKFVCSVCGKQYPLLRSLRRHEITHKAKKYLCSICGEVFHFKLYLKRHMRKHSGKKPFPCPYCNKRFSTQWNLSQHKRLHTDSLPYECRLCPTAFRHNVTLKKHVRLFHTADEFVRNHESKSAVNA